MNVRSVLLIVVKIHWLLLGFFILIGIITASTALLSILNTGYFNRLVIPIGNYIPMMKLLWQDSFTGAIQFVSTKSLFALAYLDPRSHLNLWTYEFDTISLGVYFISSMYLARTFKTHTQTSAGNLLALKVIGSVLILLSVSYMSVIQHCAGPTWIGFVAAYGFGFEGFDHQGIWQILFALCGIVLILFSHLYKPKLIQPKVSTKAISAKIVQQDKT